MKALKILLPVALVLLAGIYLASPYAAASNFSSALEERDVESASEYIDFASVRDGLKEQARAEITARALESDDNGMAMMGAAFGGAMIDAMLDATITPAGFEKMLEKASEHEADGSFEYEAGYEDLNRFAVTLLTNAKGEKLDVQPKLVFERKGFASWKLTSLDIPFASLREQIKAGNEQGPEEPDRAPVETQSPEASQNPGQTAQETQRTIQPHERPGFFYDVDEKGRPTDLDENGEPRPIPLPTNSPE